MWVMCQLSNHWDCSEEWGLQKLLQWAYLLQRQNERIVVSLPFLKVNKIELPFLKVKKKL